MVLMSECKQQEISLSKVSRISVAGLRDSDATSLYVITQDLFLQSLVRIDGRTLADVFALSEVEDQLPKTLYRDLSAFVRSKVRELEDLPGGEHLESLLKSISDCAPEKIPYSLRKALVDLSRRENADYSTLLNNIILSWDGVEPEAIVVPQKSTKVIQKPTVPKSHQTKSSRPKAKKAAKPKKKAARKPRPTPAAKIDIKRAEWIQQDLIARLDIHGERGLKESILVAGVKHRTEYTNLITAEVTAELRALAKEGKVKFSAGRWSRTKRLGW